MVCMYAGKGEPLSYLLRSMFMEINLRAEPQYPVFKSFLLTLKAGRDGQFMFFSVFFLNDKLHFHALCLG